MGSPASRGGLALAFTIAGSKKSEPMIEDLAFRRGYTANFSILGRVEAADTANCSMLARVEAADIALGRIEAANTVNYSISVNHGIFVVFFLVVEPSEIIFLFSNIIPQKEDIILLYIGYHSIPK